MITPELIGYIRGEFAKGKTREEVRKALLAEGGWTEEDINEAFKTVIPMQGFPQTSFSPKNVISQQAKRISKADLVFVLVGLLCVVLWYFFSPQITAFWNSSLSYL